MLAAGGVMELPVQARPQVVIVSTGNEVVPPPNRSSETGTGARLLRAGARRARARGRRRAPTSPESSPTTRDELRATALALQGV